jgi:hypothetical protein
MAGAAAISSPAIPTSEPSVLDGINMFQSPANKPLTLNLCHMILRRANIRPRRLAGFILFIEWFIHTVKMIKTKQLRRGISCKTNKYKC